MDNDMNNISKENVAPPAFNDVQYPALPINAKGNIFKKEWQPPSLLHPDLPNIAEPQHQTPPNVARKRQRLETLRDTPPRSSYQMQMAKIFNTPVSPRHAKEEKNRSLCHIPDDTMKLFLHFNQALQSTSRDHGERTDSVMGDVSPPAARPAPAAACYSPDTTSSDSCHSGSDGKYEARRRHGQDSTGCNLPPPSLYATRHLRTPPNTWGEMFDNDENPLDDLERAVAMAFSSNTPKRTERRKTLHINPKANSSPRPTSCRPETETKARLNVDDGAYSTEDWTDDDIFFHQAQQTQYARTPTARLARPLYPTLPSLPRSSLGTQSFVMARPSSDSSIANTSHLVGGVAPRSPRGTRFRKPIPRAPVNVAGVPLCMEEHPPSVSSDADDEAESDD